MFRTSLSIIFSNRRRNTRYISYQKELICKIIDSEITSSFIQNQFNVSKNFVKYIFCIVNNDNNDIFKSIIDRFRKFTIRDKKHILRIVRRKFKIIYRNFISKIDVICNHDIIYRLLKKKHNQLNNQKTIVIDVRNNC